MFRSYPRLAVTLKKVTLKQLTKVVWLTDAVDAIRVKTRLWAKELNWSIADVAKAAKTGALGRCYPERKNLVKLTGIWVFKRLLSWVEVH